jgi:DNA-binding helix-hairpin-helix protein with protein kinase domain
MPPPTQTFRLIGGSTITIDQRLGGGGEGTVSSVTGRSDVVAKIYNAPMSGERQAKIEAMINTAPATVHPVTAWPEDMLYNGRDAVGFLMPRVANASEAHVLYGLKSRKQKYPNANFRFLVHVAANLARAFARLHQSGIVVGDVNERVAMVTADGTVRIIDCDSFQYRHGTKLYGCDVGTPIFTPPELQGITTFRGVERTAQHDVFGLAVLIFHLLFLGRHPFAGRFLKQADMPIERAIQEHRFAYSAERGRTEMQPPPHTPPVAYSGGALTAMFEQAFAPAAARGYIQRPSAGQWANTLGAFLAQLVPCKLNASHAYVPTNGPCPWCAIELTTSVDLFSYIEPAGGTAPSTIDFEAVWRAIDGLKPFRATAAPDPASLQASCNPSPDASKVLKGRVERDAINRAKRLADERKRAVGALEEQQQKAEQGAQAAHTHAASFDSDGVCLLKLQENMATATAKAERTRLLKRLVAFVSIPVAMLAFILTQSGPLALASLVMAGVTVATLERKRIDLHQTVAKLTAAAHALRLSIDQGPERRRQLAADADQALAALGGQLTELRAKLADAIRAEQIARVSATISDSQLSTVIETLKATHKTLQRQAETFPAKAASLEAEMARGWSNILDRKGHAQAACAGIRRIEVARLAARQKAHDDARDAQLSAHLDQFFIKQAVWPRIPKSALSALYSYGIETAADVNERDVRDVPGFGEVRTHILMDWRRTKEAGFHFDPTKALHSTQLQQEERRLGAERRQKERDLVRIKTQIDAVRSGIEQLIHVYEREAQKLAKQIAQAIVDSDALRLDLPKITLGVGSIETRTVSQPMPTPQPGQRSWHNPTPSSQRYARPQRNSSKRFRKKSRRRKP